MTNKRQYKHFFTNRIVNEWNSLSEEIVSANSINIFKNKIDKKYEDLMYTINIKIFN